MTLVPAPVLAQDDGLATELRRLDHFLADELRHLRRRGRSSLGELVHGAVIEDGEAEGLLRELADEHSASGPRPRGAVEGVRGGLGTLDRATRLFSLSGFERDVLLLGLAVEIDSRYGRLVAYLNDHAERARPTVGLMGALFGGQRTEALEAFLPGGRLPRMGLVILEGDGPLPGRPVRLAEAFWPRLVGADVPLTAAELRRDDGGGLERLVLPGDLRARTAAAVRWVARRSEERPLVLLAGPPGSGREALACALAGALGQAALVVRSATLEEAGAEAMLQRETRWHQAVLVVLDTGPAERAPALLRELEAPVIWVGGAGRGEALLAGSGRPCVELELTEPALEARIEMLERLLPPERRAPDLDLRFAAGRFRFGPGRLETAARLSSSQATAFGDQRVTAQGLSEACRRLPDVQLMTLAQRLPCPFGRDDLIVPAETRRELELAIAWGRHGHAVADRAGGHPLLAGRGLACLFTGPPGTGKTMGAQVLARAMGLDLYRIDLSQVVSKYIGETEKNLGRVFDEARAGNVVLFFDEADALFGKRTEIKDAHDRYANVETGFLLQRIEQHDGVCILATNLRRNMDDAFLRRLQIVADFPMPGERERRQIWRRHLPPERCAGDVDLDLLCARFAVSGGEIRNAVTTAAVLAADAAQPVAMRHLVLGLWRELKKGGRILDPSELGPWSSVVATPPS